MSVKEGKTLREFLVESEGELRPEIVVIWNNWVIEGLDEEMLNKDCLGLFQGMENMGIRICYEKEEIEEWSKKQHPDQEDRDRAIYYEFARGVDPENRESNVPVLGIGLRPDDKEGSPTDSGVEKIAENLIRYTEQGPCGIARW
jgi:hypothetical protein